MEYQGIATAAGKIRGRPAGRINGQRNRRRSTCDSDTLAVVNREAEYRSNFVGAIGRGRDAGNRRRGVVDCEGDRSRCLRSTTGIRSPRAGDISAFRRSVKAVTPIDAAVAGARWR